MFHWLYSIARLVFGERIETGWGIAASILTGVALIAFAIGGIACTWEWMKAVEIRFDADKLDQHNLRQPTSTTHTIDWVKARIQQVRSLRFTVPFGLLVSAVLLGWVRNSFELKTYFEVALCWLIFSPVLRAWWIATAVWTERKLAKKAGVASRKVGANSRLEGGRLLSEVSVWWAIRHYLNWGLQKSTTRKMPFIGLLKFLNPIIALFGLRWMNSRLFAPLFTCTFSALVWPVSTVFCVFYLTKEFDERRQPLRPEWASRNAQEPRERRNFPDSPGDAGATS